MSPVRSPSRQIQRVPSIALDVPFDEPGWLRASPQGSPSEYSRLPWTRQTYTFSRAAAGASLTGADGSSIPGPTRDVPTIGMHDLDGDSVRERPGVRFASTDVLDIDIAFGLQEMALYLELLVGTAAVFFSIGDQTAPHLTITSASAGKYEITHDNNVDTPVTVTMASAATSGKRLQLFALLNSDGSVSLWQREDTGTWVDEGDSSAPAGGITATPGAAIASFGTDGTDDLFHGKVILGTPYDQTTIEAAF